MKNDRSNYNLVWASGFPILLAAFSYRRPLFCVNGVSKQDREFVHDADKTFPVTIGMAWPLSNVNVRTSKRKLLALKSSPTVRDIAEDNAKRNVGHKNNNGEAVTLLSL
jgi:hypothetical protein